MNKNLEEFLIELTLLCERYKIGITNDHVSVLLNQEESGYFYTHEDLRYDEKTKQYTIEVDSDPYNPLKGGIK